jgi:hypothetical protein
VKLRRVNAAALMHALFHASLTHICCGSYTAATAEADELVALADEKTALFFKAIRSANAGSGLL